MSKVNIFFADGLEEIEGLTVVDLLRRAGIETTIVSIMNSLEINGSHGIKITADKMLKDVDFKNSDMIVLPGGLKGTNNLGNCKELVEQIKSYNKDGKMLAAICAAPSIFGENNVLDGKRATCYPGFEDKLKGASVVNAPVVKSQNVITSRGMGTSHNFGLAIVEHYLGKEKAKELAESVQFNYYE